MIDMHLLFYTAREPVSLKQKKSSTRGTRSENKGGVLMAWGLIIHLWGCSLPSLSWKEMSNLANAWRISELNCSCALNTYVSKKHDSFDFFIIFDQILQFGW